MLKVVSDLVVSVILEWNKLDTDMRNSTSINIFKKPLLQFVRPSPKSLFNCHIPKGIKYEIRSRLVLSIYENTSLNTAFKIPWIHFAIVVVKQKQLVIFLFTAPSFIPNETPLRKNQKHWYFYIESNNSNFTKILVFGDPLNSVTIDTIILILLQMLLLTLF